DHSRQPVNRSIGIAATDGFYQRGSDVVVLLAAFVVKGDILLDEVSYKIIRNDYFSIFSGMIGNQFQDVVKLTGIAAGVLKQGVVFFDPDGFFFQIFIFFQGAIDKVDQFFFSQLF